ncbi:MAG: bifunctional molybdenum cofactor biosynthesis protein MoaC/MoaB [Pseudonocardia sp.]|nr:MAG: bifunctional molybdenum cofactor biosynthesis protein MoaC/MoaB [Pseudonocardia sp.]
MNELTHLDIDGRARMIDVSSKQATRRTAVARGRFVTTPTVVELIRNDDLPKADVLSTARIAGVLGAKRTSELIPLCHQLSLTAVDVSFELTETSIEIVAQADTTDRTGVEMEALTAVAVAGLTLHDMVKAVDPAASTTEIQLVRKTGGKKGVWDRQPVSMQDLSADTPTAAVLVASTGTARGTRVDKTGPLIKSWLEAKGFDVRGPLIYADADIANGLVEALRGAPRLVLSTGGTGVSPTDATPESTTAILDIELPGLMEAIRRKGSDATPHAALSRAVAGLVGRTVVVNLPGSTAGVRDGLGVLDPVLEHLLAQVAGGGSHD